MSNDSPTQAPLRDDDIVDRVRRTLRPEDQDLLLATESLIHLLKTYGTVFDALGDALAPYGLSVAQFNLLVILSRVPERRLQMSEIGERMSVTRTNITKLVDCLEREDLVRRAHRAGDRRVVLAELTEKGLDLLHRAQPCHFAKIRALWAEMSDEECLQLTHLLLKLKRSAHTAIEASPVASGNRYRTPLQEASDALDEKGCNLP